MRLTTSNLCLAATFVLLSACLLHADSVPLLAKLTATLGPDGKPVLVEDALKLSLPVVGPIDAFDPAPGPQGASLRFGTQGVKPISTSKIELLNKAGAGFTICFWVNVSAYPTGQQGAGLIAKRGSNVASPFVLSIGKNGEFGFEGFNGVDWSSSVFSGPRSIKTGRWTHLSLSFAGGKSVLLYVDGKPVASRQTSRAMAGNDQPLVIGRDAVRGDFNGAMGSISIYAAALSAEQVQADREGKLATRRAVADDFPPPLHPVELTLGRYDTPRARTDGFAPTRLAPQRLPGPHAVDWVRLYWNDRALFEKQPSEKFDIRLRDGVEARHFFQQPNDEVLTPGNHWFRPLQWLWGRRYVYQADVTARSGETRYELWVFPVQISGNLQRVRLECEGKLLYDRDESLQSLTLLVPQNAPGKPYQLSINDQPAVEFDAGLQTIVPGNPKEKLIPINLTIGSSGVTVKNLPRPADFAYQAEWEKDLNDPSDLPALVTAKDEASAWLAPGVKRSPIEIFTVALPHGMSGGHFMRSEHKSSGPNASDDPKTRFEGGVNDYAEFLSDLGYDKVYEMSGNNAFNKSDERSYDALAAATAKYGIRLGITPGVEWKRPFLAHPNLAFFAMNLPDYRAPLYRDVQLIAQRMHRYGNFAGISIGADNAAYESFWSWAPPEPGRPWAEAFTTFALDGKSATNPTLAWPEPKPLGGKSTVKAFQDYIARYNRAFEQYGYFDVAVREVDPAVSATTGSYGSSPGVGGRGGYPWATIPAKSLFSELSLIQVYDWNEVPASKPMHNVALIDRAKSYYPDKRLQTLIDDFGLFFGREARQRAYALALTRGVDAIGTSFLASPYNARPRVLKEQRELYASIKTMGGAYVGTRSDASVGVLYVNEQALLRRPNQEANPSDAKLFDGSHEGKTTEALILCHAAGWPARIVTPDELKRGLPKGMRVLLLVGLNREDDSWVWSDGLEPALEAFTKSGGRIVRDQQSVCPTPSVATPIKVRAYIAQGAGTDGGQDRMPQILERNRENITYLREALTGIPAPVAVSGEPTVWAIPHTTGDVQYVTVVNWSFEPGKNASQFVRPVEATIEWKTDKPIYALPDGNRLTAAEAARVDFRRNGSALFAIPAREPTPPTIAIQNTESGAIVVRADVAGMHGVPIRIEITRADKTDELFGASATDIVLPRHPDATPIRVTVTELLSGKSAEKTHTPVPVSPIANTRHDAIGRFVARKAPLTIALTPAQADEPAVKEAVRRLQEWLKGRGRESQIARVEPNGVVLSTQPLLGSQTFPRWKTIESDLILIGSVKDNVLIRDQARGALLDPDDTGALVTYSPFVGEHNVLNLLVDNVQNLSAAVDAVISERPARRER